MSELSEPPTGESIEELARHAPSADDGSDAQDAPGAAPGQDMEGLRQNDTADTDETADDDTGAGENYAGSGF